MTTKIPLVSYSGLLSEIASTDTIPVANLGSGTANSTTFLRGDGTWAVPTIEGTLLLKSSNLIDPPINTLSIELWSNSGWTINLHSGSWSTGFISYSGKGTSGPISNNIPAEVGSYYLITWSTTPPYTTPISSSLPLGTFGGVTVYSGMIFKALSTNSFISNYTNGTGSLKKVIINSNTPEIKVSNLSGVLKSEMRFNGTNNNFIGSNSGIKNIGNDNTGYGYNSLSSNNTGYGNTAIGSNTLTLNFDAYYNTGIGTNALASNVSGSFNTCIGYAAGSKLKSSSNLAIGIESLSNSPIATNCVAIGNYALTAKPQVTFSTLSLVSVYGGITPNATFTNVQSYYVSGTPLSIYPKFTIVLTNGTPTSITTSDTNIDYIDNTTCLGIPQLNGSGSGAIISINIAANTNNIAIGNNSLQKLKAAYSNIAIGVNTLLNNISGNSNIAIGSNVLQNITTGIRNIAIGDGNTTGTTGSYNTILGCYNSQTANTTNYSTIIGYFSKANDYNISIGYIANADAVNAIAIGKQTSASSNSLSIGNNCGSNPYGSNTNNTIIGHYNGIYINYYLSGTYNLILGQSNYVSGYGTNNIILGHSNLNDLPNEYTPVSSYNAIIIGNNIKATRYLDTSGKNAFYYKTVTYTVVIGNPNKTIGAERETYIGYNGINYNTSTTATYIYGNTLYITGGYDTTVYPYPPSTVNYINFKPNNCTWTTGAASIGGYCDTTAGGHLEFYTVNAGATTLTEQLRIGAAGQVGIKGANFGLAGQKLTSTGTTTGVAWAYGSPPVSTATNLTVADDTTSIICTATSVITLPTHSGRQLNIKTTASTTVTSASANIIPLAGGTGTTSILTGATGSKWCLLHCDGTNWHIMAQG